MNLPTLQPKAAAILSGTAWLFNFACQMYGMTSDPNMKDIADDYHSFLSPQPFAIAIFFFPQTILQVYWIYRLWKNANQSNLSGEPGENEGLNSGPSDEDEELDEAAKYAPIFALGNFSIGLWMVSWNSEHLGIALIFVLINSSSQLYYVLTRLPPLNRATWLTHVVAKMFAGIGVLDIFDNAASFMLNYKYDQFYPGIVSMVLTFAASVAFPLIFDPIMGACIVYDFAGLFFGQLTRGWWTWVLFMSTVISALVVLFKVAKEKDTYRAILADSSSVL